MPRKSQAKGRIVVRRPRPVMTGTLPQLHANLSFTKKFRFYATAGPLVSRSVLASDICRCLVTFAEDQGTYADFNAMIRSARIIAIDVFCAASALGSLTTASIQWLSTSGNIGKEDSETSVSTTLPLRLRSRPPEDYPAYFPQGNTASTPLFLFTIPKGAVLDITLDCVMDDSKAPYVFSTYSGVFQATGATPGAILGGSLDQTSSYVLGEKPAMQPIGLVPAFNSYQT